MKFVSFLVIGASLKTIWYNSHKNCLLTYGQYRGCMVVFSKSLDARLLRGEKIIIMILGELVPTEHTRGARDRLWQFMQNSIVPKYFFSFHNYICTICISPELEFLGSFLCNVKFGDLTGEFRNFRALLLRLANYLFQELDNHCGLLQLEVQFELREYFSNDLMEIGNMQKHEKNYKNASVLIRKEMIRVPSAANIVFWKWARNWYGINPNLKHMPAREL